MGFATAEDLRTYIGRAVAFTADETAAAELALELLFAQIQAAAGQTIELVADDELTRPGSWRSAIELPQRPVVSVASVTLNGLTLLADTDYVFDGRFTLRRGGLGVRSSCGYWGGLHSRLVIVYTHGLAESSAIKGIELGAAARAFANPAGEIQEAIGSYSVTYNRAAGVMLSKDERGQARRVLGIGSSSPATPSPLAS